MILCFWAIPRNKMGKHAQKKHFPNQNTKNPSCEGRIRHILRKMCLMVWKRTVYGNVDLSTTCQCRQLRLNPLSTQINIYCLMTNQTPALLVQRASWTRAAVMLLQSLYFSRPPPPPPPRAIIPDARPLGTFENQDIRDGKTRYI